jgi:ubiquitin C-terminal hydrolase
MNNINNNQNDNIVDLKDCFNYDRRINAMQGDNAMFCNYCHKITPSNSQSTLVTLPEVLIILLNRGHGIQYNIKLQFYEKMNFSEYIDEIDKQQGNYNYKLIGVITHIGGNNMTGHFIAYCLHPLEYTWHKYNDAFVSKVNNFQDEVVSYAMPYLLFYQKE